MKRRPRSLRPLSVEARDWLRFAALDPIMPVLCDGRIARSLTLRGLADYAPGPRPLQGRRLTITPSCLDAAEYMEPTL